MSQVRLPASLAFVTPVLLGFVLLASPAQAAVITLDFSGTVDMSSVGGSPLHTFSGSLTWDTAIAAFEPDPFDPAAPEATYDPVSYTLLFDGVDHTAPVIGDGTGSGVTILNDSELLTPGTPIDGFAFFLEFPAPFEVAGEPGDLILVGALAGPTTMFATNALPGDLNFLTQITGASSFWLFDPNNAGEAFIEPVGTLIVAIPGGPVFDPGPIAPVPEPVTASLLALGLAGGFARLRRARR